MPRALAALLVALALSAGGARADELTLNFRDSPPGAVIDAIARATGTRFSVDPALRGQLTIALEDKVSPAEALEVLNAALLTVGYAPVPSPAGGYVILPIEAAKAAAPWIHRSVSEASERMVTTLVRLHAANAEELAKQLAPADRSSLVIPYPATNSLIIAAAEDRIAHMLDLLRALDQAAATRLEVLPLRWADAQVVAQQLQIRFDDKADTRPTTPLRVVPEPRTNSLVVGGAPERIAEVRRYVELVDVPRRSKSRLHVVRVLNVDAEELAQQLSTLTLEEPPPGGVPGAPSAALASPVPGTAGLGGTGGLAGAGLRGKSFSVTADPATNSLIIGADPDTFALLADTIAALDRIPPRISIEAQVLLFQSTRELDLGFDALLPVLVPNNPGEAVAFAVLGNPAPLITSEAQQVIPFVVRFARRPLIVPVVGPDGTPTTVVVPQGAAQITASQGDASLRQLAAPFLLAANGQEQHIFEGENVPLPVSASNTTGTLPGTSSTTTPGSVSNNFTIDTQIQRQDVGIDFRVKPTALADHLTAMEVAITVSSVGASASAAVASQVGPTLNQIKLDAHVRVDDGSVVLLASAPQDTTSTSEATVPWLGSIPILGWFFKHTADNVNRQRLVITLQATELHSPAEERAEQMERTLAFERRNLRMQPLRATATEPYALLVATRATREQAEDVLPEISDLPGTPQIIEWRDGDSVRFDVYLTGFPEIGPLASESLLLRQRGFMPRFEIVTEPRT
ncbi:MAG TPA: secretin N-terminal domain-containing protein [Myxococcota bacterium]|nr:secretin N-terminal domain-containing protein [Myxococcota bacterium]